MSNPISKHFSKGIWLMLLATFSFSLMNIFAKLLHRLPVMEIVFFRCFISVLFCTAALLKEKVSFKGTNFKPLISRGLTGTTALILYFITLHNIPMGTAVTIQYMSPIFSVVMAYLFLKQTINRLQWLCFIAAFVGVALIKGFDNSIQLNFLLIGLLSSLLSAVSYTLISMMKKTEHPMLVVFYFMLIGSIVGFIGMLFHFEKPTLMEFVYLILVGITTQLGQINMTRALQAEALGKVSIVQYIGIVFALIFGVLLFGETYTVLMLFGIAIIAASVVTNVLLAKS